jgi:hypothetical protein
LIAKARAQGSTARAGRAAAPHRHASVHSPNGSASGNEETFRNFVRNACSRASQPKLSAAKVIGANEYTGGRPKPACARRIPIQPRPLKPSAAARKHARRARNERPSERASASSAGGSRNAERTFRKAKAQSGPQPTRPRRTPSSG